MRIALCSRELAPYSGGGIGAFTASMARVLAQAGHQVHVLTLPHPGLPEQEGGFHLHPVIPSGEELRVEHLELRHSLALARTLATLGQLDVVEFPDFGAEGYFSVLAKRAGTALGDTPLLVRLHTPNREVREADGDHRLDLHLATLDHAEDEAIRLADHVLAPTHFILDRVRARLPTLPPATIVRHPIDPAFLAETAPGQTPPGSPARVVYVGRLQRLKGVETLARAGIRLVEAGTEGVFEFFGADTPTGPGGSSMRAHLETVVGAHRERFRFQGHQPRSRILDAVRRAAVCCFPSQWDNLSSACLEAMAAGRPVVVSDAGGMPEIVQDGQSGLVVPVSDVAALATAIRRLLGDPALAEKLGRQGRSRVEAEFSPRAALDRYSQAVEVARSSRGRKPAVSPPSITAVVLGSGDVRALGASTRSIETQTVQPVDRFVLAGSSVPPLPGWGVEVMAGPMATLRDRALELGTGEWVLVLRAGTTVQPDYVRRTGQAASRGADVVLVLSRGPEGPVLPQRPDPDLLIFRDLTLGRLPVLLRRAALQRVPERDGELNFLEDWELAFQLAVSGLETFVLPEFLASLGESVGPEPLGAASKETASLLARYATTARDSSRPVRMLHAELAKASVQPLRYRLADALNSRLKRLGPFHRVLKGTLRRR